MVVKADVSDGGAVFDMGAAVENELGPIDLLVTSAGIVRSQDHTEMEFAHWRKMMAVNVDGIYHRTLRCHRRDRACIRFPAR